MKSGWAALIVAAAMAQTAAADGPASFIVGYGPAITIMEGLETSAPAVKSSTQHAAMERVTTNTLQWDGPNLKWTDEWIDPMSVYFMDMAENIFSNPEDNEASTSIPKTREDVFASMADYRDDMRGYRRVVRTLAPSPTQPGDFDLVRREEWEPDAEGKLGEAQVFADTIPSYLHRIDDPRLAEIAELTAKVAGGPEALATGMGALKVGSAALRAKALMEAFGAAHEDDPIVRNFWLSTRPPSMQVNLFAPETLDKWLEDAERMPAGLLRSQTASQLRDQFHALHARALAGSNQAVEWPSERSPDSADWHAVIAKLRADNAAMLMQRQPPLNFLGLQIAAKVLRTSATLDLINGHWAESLDTLAGVHLLGTRLGVVEGLIDSVFGAAVRMVGIGGLEVFVLNAIETKEDAQAAWAAIEATKPLPVPETVARCQRLITHDAHESETAVRLGVADARYDLLLVALAARGHQAETGDLPKTPGDLATYFADGLPKDRFSTLPLQMQRDPETLLIHSVGPDWTDNNATVLYDPTNGTTSAGDLIVRIPKKRQYPFPRGGVKANTAQEVEALFPEGLPPDNFADSRTRGIGIAPGTPPLIYSFGPDADESAAQRHGGTYTPEVQYDPTNGIVSNGDIWRPIAPQ